MKAVICTKYGPPEVLQIKDVQKPVPKDNEVLIKVHATTVTVADFRIRSFTVPSSYWIPARIALGLTKPRKSILGVELAGFRTKKPLLSPSVHAQRFIILREEISSPDKKFLFMEHREALARMPYNSPGILARKLPVYVAVKIWIW